MARGYPDYRYFSFPVSVSEGGTGAGSFTLNGVLLGNATSAFLVTAAGAAYQALRVPAAGGAPAFGALDLAQAAAFTGLLPIAKGGTGTATPALVAGAGISITGTWPANTITNTSPASALGDPVTIAHGGSGTATPALVAGAAISITGTWPANTITNTSPASALGDPVTVAHGGSGTATPALVAGSGIAITGTWPANTITNSSAYATLADPLTVAHGGTGTATPALVAGAAISITGTWPANTITNTSPASALGDPVTVAHGGTGTATAFTAGSVVFAGAAGVYAQENANLFWDNTSKRLGIGTPEPFGPLQVYFNGTGDDNIGGSIILNRYYSAGSWRAAALFSYHPAGGSDVLAFAVSGDTTPGDIAKVKMVIDETGRVGIGTKIPAKQLDVTGDIRASLQLISTVATGTAPLSVASTTEVANLNADRVGGTEITNAATADLVPIGSGAGTAAWSTPDGARVYNSAALTIPNITATKLTFDAERYDNGGLHSTSSNTGRLTAVRAGKYLISGHIGWAASATGIRSLSLLLNNTTFFGRHVTPGVATYQVYLSVSSIYHLAAADYVEIQVVQTSGGDLNIVAEASATPEFAMQWLGP
jgi:hypothetical protein